ncbi:two-component response regulator ARR10-like [Benincasa hispida]|uniref:two-component response regulator ARR10-like n=1 Tax=Benincasa hispida TaxID=102211 RepID=UPI00190216ED|nr:two-component response regulator ARR10-like [Benincasa hispida]
MTGDDNEIAKLGCLFKGAMLHLVKPLTMKTIRNLWQFAVIKGIITQPPPNNNNPVPVQQHKKMIQIRKQQPHHHSRPKLIWTQQLHNTFLHTIQALGLDKAHPKEILQHMNVPGLRKQNISSHLQKFRLSLKRDEEDAIHQNKIYKDEESVIEFRNQEGATNSASSIITLGKAMPQPSANYHQSQWKSKLV